MTVGEVYRVEDAEALARRIAAATGAKASTPREGELLRFVPGNLFVVDRAEDGTYRLREFERGAVEFEVRSDAFDPIVRALTLAVAPSASNVRYDPDWQSARLDPRFACSSSDLRWPADEHGSWAVFDGGAASGPMRLARVMDASIEEIAQAMAHPESGHLLDGIYRLV